MEASTLLEQFIRQAYAECERIEGSGQASATGAAREVAMIKTRLEEAGALLANAEAKAVTGRPILDLPTLGMIQAFQAGDVDDQIGGPFDRDARVSGREPAAIAGPPSGGTGVSNPARDMGGGERR